jgi:hypothetical protein
MSKSPGSDTFRKSSDHDGKLRRKKLLGRLRWLALLFARAREQNPKNPKDVDLQPEDPRLDQDGPKPPGK